jgi:NAD(P)-dependent dehydrogenase (short-subunit alcohol dehydrogenase family)
MFALDWLPRHFLAGKTAFITGGGSGINLGIARAYGALGANVAICGRSQHKLDAAAALLRSGNAQGRVLARAADVRAPDQLQSAFRACQDELGPIDILVCGAAGNFLVAAENLSPNGFKTVIDIDLLGSFHAARLAFEQLRATRGCLLFISASMGQVAHAYQVHVGAAKAGIDMMMRNLAVEWGPYGIRVNSIVPGAVADTEGVRRLTTPESAASLAQENPLRRLGTIDDIANAAVLLVSPLAAYINGVVLPVDGGQGLLGSSVFNQGAREFLAALPAETRRTKLSSS